VKKLSLLLSLVALPALAGPDRSQPPKAELPEPYRARAPLKTLLRDGPTFHFISREGPPLVDVVVRVGVGGRDDPDDRPGLAAWTAAMLTEGAGKRDALALADEIDFLGADLTVEPGWDATVVHLHVPASRLLPALKLLLDVLRRPQFNAADWSRVQQQQRNDFLAERDSPWRIAARARARALFGERRYATPLHGDELSLDRTRPADLKAFHDTYYRSDNLEIVVAGNAHLEEVTDDLRKVFVRWRPPRAALERAEPKLVRRPPARRVVLVDKPGAAQSILYASALAPPGLHPLAPDTEVMNTLLGGSFTSRLNQNLREKNQYSYGARSSFNVGDETRTFSARAAVQTDVTAPALRELFGELKRIRSYVIDDEAERARAYSALTFPSELSTGRGAAQFWSWAIARGLHPKEVAAYPSRVLGTDHGATLRAARRDIDLARMQLVVVGDAAKIKKDLEALKLGPVEAWTVEELFGR
jgi:zinc protease